MDLIAAFERAIEGMDWEELVSTLQRVLNDLLDNRLTSPPPASSSLPLPSVPAGLKLNTCLQPALGEGGGAVCHLTAAPTSPQGVYSQGQYLPYQWPLANDPMAAVVSPSAVPPLTYNNAPVVRLPDHVIPRPIGMLNGQLLYVLTADTSAPPVNTSSSQKKKKKKVKCESQQGEDKPYIKKPLNAFMLFSKEQRANAAAQIMKQKSTIVNVVLGQRWNSMTREEQAKYYDQAEKERLLHAQRHPGWSTSDNYGKKRKMKKGTVRNSRKDKVFTCKREEETGGMEAPLAGRTGVMEPCALRSVKVQKPPRSETPAPVFVCGTCHLPQFSSDSWLDAAPSTSQAALALPPQAAPSQRTSEDRCQPVMQHLEPLCLTAQPQLPSSSCINFYTVNY